MKVSSWLSDENLVLFLTSIVGKRRFPIEGVVLECMPRTLCFLSWLYLSELLQGNMIYVYVWLRFLFFFRPCVSLVDAEVRCNFISNKILPII
jgi:hypothetical protein